MCGILGIVSVVGRAPSVEDQRVEAMRDRMAHRGPDGCGLWRSENAVLAHRRLAVVDPSPAGRQPMVSASGRSVLVYNGELYNDAEMRAERSADGHSFISHSDAETVLAVLDRDGERGVARLRGMYALAYLDLDAQVLVLARDPLGVKPLYYATVEVAGGSELVFASEIAVLLAHPAVTPRPDFVTISSYLTTIRTTLGGRTLFSGIRTLEPGETATVYLRRPQIAVTTRRWWRPEAAGVDHGAGLSVRTVIEDSVGRHLRADVPVCCLVSGGLDSTIIASVAKQRGREGELRTYSSGCPEGSCETDDLSVARLVAGRLGTKHAEAPVSREFFSRRWPEMVEAYSLPLSTPNEVAINAVARRLRADGQVVALSGEGADELFGGYETPLTMAAKHLAAMAEESAGAWRGQGGLFQLDANAWVARSAKESVLNADARRGAEGDSHLEEFYVTRFGEIANAADGPAGLEAHLRFSREINLTGLLLRLDQATMLEGVEGRTPFADQAVAEMAARLPMDRKFVAARGGPSDEPTTPAQTKIALREAFGGELPSMVLARPKASFPLPFQGWLVDQVHVVGESRFARMLFTDGAIAAVTHSPQKFWPIAWPMLNLAMWGRRWWD